MLILVDSEETELLLGPNLSKMELLEVFVDVSEAVSRLVASDVTKKDIRKSFESKID